MYAAIPSSAGDLQQTSESNSTSRVRQQGSEEDSIVEYGYPPPIYHLAKPPVSFSLASLLPISIKF